MDLTKPIDITLVNAAVVKHKNVLVAIDKLSANAVLSDCTPMPGITLKVVLSQKDTQGFSLVRTIWVKSFHVP